MIASLATCRKYEADDVPVVELEFIDAPQPAIRAALIAEISRVIFMGFHLPPDVFDRIHGCHYRRSESVV